MSSQNQQTKTIELKYSTWRKLTDIKLDQKKRSLDEVVVALMDQIVEEAS